MNGRLIYLAVPSLFGVAGILTNFPLWLIFLLLYVCLLMMLKKGSKMEITLIFFLYGLFTVGSWFSESRHHTNMSEAVSSITVLFDEEITVDGDLLKAPVKEVNYDEKLMIRYRFHSKKEKEHILKKVSLGSSCSFNAVLKTPQGARNPNAFDYKSYLQNHHIYWVAEIKQFSADSCTASRSGPVMKVKKWRSNGIAFIESNFPKELSPLAAALIFGERSLFEADLLGAYQKIGIIHLLAISGLHVSLLAGIVFYIGLRMGITKELMRKILLLLLPLYGILAGGAPSVNRSVIMLLFFLLFSKRKGKIKLSALDALSLAFILLLLVNPRVLFDIGFQLSFAVTAGLILSVPYILAGDRNPITQLLLTSYISQLVSLPLILYHFYGLSLIGLAANLLYIPLFSFIIMPGLFLLYFCKLLLDFMPLFLVRLLILIVDKSSQIAKSLSKMTFVDLTTGKYNTVTLALLMALVAAVFIVWEKKRNRQFLLFMLITPWIFIAGQKWLFDSGYGEVTMIDVGQGDSILIKLPDDSGNYLIDTGGMVVFDREKWQERKKVFEVGRDTVVPFLKSMGISELDKLILTHGDMDHIGGALPVLEGIKIKEVLLPSTKDRSKAENDIVKMALAKNIRVHEVSAGDQWKAAQYTFHILNPERGFEGERNEGSIVIHTRLGGLDWLFTGDLNESGEQKLLRHYPHLKADVLKVGHHGSETSSSEVFLRRIRPRMALFSVGEKNRFGHPSPKVLERLSEHGSKIYRTDQNGAITFQFFENKGTFSSVIPYNETNSD